MQLHGKRSWFVAEEAELAQTQTRYEEHDIHITAPLPGKGDLGTQAQALIFETDNSWLRSIMVISTTRAS